MNSDDKDIFTTDFLPYVFGKVKTFSAEQYYNAMVTECPEYKDTI